MMQLSLILASLLLFNPTSLGKYLAKILDVSIKARVHLKVSYKYPTAVYSLNLSLSPLERRNDINTLDMGLGTWLRIVQSFTLLPLGTAINRVPSSNFFNKVVVKALRRFPQFGNLASYTFSTTN